MAKHYQSPIIYRLREIPIKQIKIWKDAQARKLDREGIAELAKSIKNEGLLFPIDSVKNTHAAVISFMFNLFLCRFSTTDAAFASSKPYLVL